MNKKKLHCVLLNDTINQTEEAGTKLNIESDCTNANITYYEAVGIPYQGISALVLFRSMLKR